MNEFIRTLIAGAVSGTVVSTIVGLLFRKRIISMEERIKNQIKSQYEKGMAVFQSTRSWKEKSVAQLLGPLHIQFDRTARAFHRWEGHNTFLEAKVIREGNLTIRDLLLTKADLIPEELREDAGKLIEHYDRWLEEFERLRNREKPDLTTPFVFVGPEGYPFPTTSERSFQYAFQTLWAELYRAPQEPPMQLQ